MDKAMKYIQIAPKREHCRVEGGKISGWMPIGHDRGVLYTYQAPEHMHFVKAEYKLALDAFCTAIALASKRWQVEEALNAHFGNIEGTFEIQDCHVNPYANERN